MNRMHFTPFADEDGQTQGIFYVFIAAENGAHSQKEIV